MSHLLCRAYSIYACWHSVSFKICIVWMITQMNEYKPLLEWLHRKNILARTKISPSTTLSTTNPTCTGLRSNLGLHDESDQLCKPWHSFILSLFVNLFISPAHIALWTLYCALHHHRLFLPVILHWYLYKLFHI